MDSGPQRALGRVEKDGIGVGSMGSYSAAIDYKTGKTVWRHRYPGTGGGGGNGLLTTAGGLLFGGDAGGNLVAYDAATGKILWHARLGQISNAPQTYLLRSEERRVGKGCRCR